MFENWTMEKARLNPVFNPPAEMDFDEYIKQFEADKKAARNEYKQVADWCNAGSEYTIVENGDSYEVQKRPQPTPEELIKIEIAELKAKLAETDYVVIKIAEGAATPEEYAEVIAQRQAWRARINELEGNNEDLAESEAENGNLD